MELQFCRPAAILLVQAELDLCSKRPRLACKITGLWNPGQDQPLLALLSENQGLGAFLLEIKPCKATPASDIP